MRGHDIYSSEDEAACESVSKDSDDINNKNAYACEDDLLMIRETLNNQSSPLLESQRENIFIIDAKFWKTHVLLSYIMVHVVIVVVLDWLKSNSFFVPHPKPYKLHWLNEEGTSM